MNISMININLRNRHSSKSTSIIAKDKQKFYFLCQNRKLDESVNELDVKRKDNKYR